MKSYKVKIKCHGFSMNEIVPDHPWVFGNQISCELYPEIFEEIKEPLFITFDGVELFEGMSFYTVNNNDELDYFVDTKDVKTCEFTAMSYSRFNEYTSKVFSSKEAAEKWIDENKPIFSKKQINDAIKDCAYSTREYITKELGI